jgi:hypothetical protein
MYGFYMHQLASGDREQWITSSWRVGSLDHVGLAICSGDESLFHSASNLCEDGSKIMGPVIANPSVGRVCV